MSTDSEKQKDEIVALESIYNKEEFSYHKENEQYECTLKAYVTIPPEYSFTYKDSRCPEEPIQSVPISHLPPLSLFITLPSNYPSESPPKFTLVSSWLSQYVIAKLCKKLDQLWEENKGLEILFTWMAFLKDETLGFLNIETSLAINYGYTCYKMALEKTQNAQDTNKFKDGNEEIKTDSNSKEVKCNKSLTKQRVRKTTDEKHSARKRGRKQKTRKFTDQRAVSDQSIGRNPVQMLIDYDSKRKQTEFKRNFYTCKICFLDKLGIHCTQFVPCFHVFCKECILTYLEIRIQDGNVKNICCPEEKCLSEATPGQVKDLVSQELFAKYDATLLSVTLDTMTDIVYCPRPHCQYPVSREPNDRMANCPACQYAFCIYCKMVYHGIEPCKFKSAEKQKLVTEYQNAPDDKKIQLEQRYGKKQLQTLVENTMSETWINTYSRNCPHCNAAIEKSDGCNKMVCWRCNTYFCWLCGTRLRADTPYVHFRNPQSKCYNMLFHGVVQEEDDDEDDIDLPALYLDVDSNDEDSDDDAFMVGPDW
ncbi:E3 ubiquitin-protein ligase RNF14-like [Diprion similis]|uniref:E3 ubiquitin-protein ligase RNF14-like n=1 Tax=Diprion similis TaxID=362088 RepID=UPI001EF9069B|nr:E3 ubiquitin-protein ligase RNF14-like [Diprion similis]